MQQLIFWCIMLVSLPIISESYTVEYLYAPWRESYQNNHQPTDNNCVFCYQFGQNTDDNYFILKRFAHTYITLNLYPYNKGHLLIIPVQHVTAISELPPEAQYELIQVIAACEKLIKKVLKPNGINVGINLGNGSGASIAHIHVHMVPRWINDTGFVQTTAHTHVICCSVKAVYEQLKPHFETLTL